MFEGRVAITVAVAAGPGAAAAAELRGVVEAQACNDQLCLAPAEAPFAVALAGASSRRAGAPAAAPPPQRRPRPAGGRGISGRVRLRTACLLQLAIVFLAGLALNLTPCVYPLIPITIGFFTAQEQRDAVADLAPRDRLRARDERDLLGARRAGRALGTAVRLGVAVAVGRRPHRRRAAGARRLDVRSVGAARALVGDARFGRALRRWRRALDGARRRARGGAVHRPVRPRPADLRRPAPGRGARLRALLRALARPRPALPAARASSRARSSGCPNSGAWMVGVRQLFGVLLVALAGYFARPFLPPGVGDAVFAGLLVAGGCTCSLVARPGHEHPWIDRFMRLASAAVLVAGCPPGTRARRRRARPSSRGERTTRAP